MKDKKDIEKRITEIEKEMNRVDFWEDKQHAQTIIQEYNELKDEAAGVDKMNKKDVVVTIFAGAGGLDAEDFAEKLVDMYFGYFKEHGWEVAVIHKNQNDHGGYRNITFEVYGKDVYGLLKNESGVHRLVRVSPFNSRSQRHTSFAMVEVVPKFDKTTEVDIPEQDLEVEFSKSGGPGGQNVNKRETAVRIVHEPTKISVSVDSERTQERNRAKALEILRGKLYYVREQERKKKAEGYSVSATTDNEWGNQIRSYVLHPYKMVKDHRTEIEVRDVESVFDGKIEEFIEAEKNL